MGRVSKQQVDEIRSFSTSSRVFVLIVFNVDTLVRLFVRGLVVLFDTEEFMATVKNPHSLPG